MTEKLALIHTHFAFFDREGLLFESFEDLFPEVESKIFWMTKCSMACLTPRLSEAVERPVLPHPGLCVEGLKAI